jgi:hypothetical protein
MKFWIPHIGGAFMHKDSIEFIPAGNKKWRFTLLWMGPGFPFAWFYISKKWNITWNIDKKLWFSIYDWRKL